ncbi:LysM peptidoglycan-binding domain-containing protein [Paenibacillus sp. LMG 31456]|uniref:LysM peptidoglycan-binding domain-containing protein n=1 Tax=Paenibacillus foliorum TaxID=2654974 RepID=A0A972GYC0_9BACL|nr:LysM peptidoglycan-binding domain-containing protein [Paenibacillus foliorum]NOU96047.1 LysM peptidoglycan-binding domain-containing protein [Paenibacillus foliorum]
MKIHMVKKGDTLYDIANKYNVELDKLIANNPQIADPNVIEVGMKVKIPNAPKPVIPPTDYLYKHIVVQGDSLWKLGKAWNVPLQEMIEANPQLKNPNVLMTGEAVYIPKLKSPSKPHHQHQHHYDQHGHSYNPKAQPPIPTPSEPAHMVENNEPMVSNEAEKMEAKPVAPIMEAKPNEQIAPIMEAKPSEQIAPIMEAKPSEQIAPIMEVQKPAAQLPYMPEFTMEAHMPEESNKDLFQQFQVPATEVFSFDYESWNIHQQPSFHELPSADNMPYTPYPEAATMPAYFMPPQQPNFNDCGCGGPAFPSYEQAMPYPYGPHAEFPIAEHPAFAHAGHHFPHTPYPNMMMHEMEAPPWFQMPYDAVAMTNAFPGPGFPSYANQAYPSYESPLGMANVNKGCNCGCHDRANENIQPLQQVESPTIVSQKEEKAKVNHTKSSKRTIPSTEAAVKRLTQKKRRNSSPKGKSQQSPWINV